VAALASQTPSWAASAWSAVVLTLKTAAEAVEGATAATTTVTATIGQRGGFPVRITNRIGRPGIPLEFW
jgi:hypothetical protein